MISMIGLQYRVKGGDTSIRTSRATKCRLWIVGHVKFLT